MEIPMNEKSSVSLGGFQDFLEIIEMINGLTNGFQKLYWWVYRWCANMVNHW